MVGLKVMHIDVIQPNGFAAEIVMVEEFKLKASTEEKVINSYTIYA